MTCRIYLDMLSCVVCVWTCVTVPWVDGGGYRSGNHHSTASPPREGDVELVIPTADVEREARDVDAQTCLQSNRLHGQCPRLLLYGRRLWTVSKDLAVACWVCVRNVLFCLYILIKQVQTSTECVTDVCVWCTLDGDASVLSL